MPFLQSGLEQSLNARYTLQTAHSTVIRFPQPLRNPEVFLQEFSKYRYYNFKDTTSSEVELVFNDWYQQQEKVKILATFKPN